MINTTKQHSATGSTSADLFQRYSNIMNDTMATYFPQLYSAPDSLYIMMATMELESGFRIYHAGGTTPNHASVGTGSGVGRSYWYDPVITPLKSSTDPNVQANILEGLSAKALMATMGMYQVRNCRESNAIIKGQYRVVAENNHLMVNPGESISAVFTNDDEGAKRSIIMGCIIMEHKYLTRLQKNNETLAIRLAVGDYLGKAGVRDVLGTSPEVRIQNVLDSKTNTGRTLLAANLTTFDASDYKFYRAPQKSLGQSETKTSTVASSNNVRINTNGCNRA